jgi:hypothetical protein
MTSGVYNGLTFGVPTPIGGVGGGLYTDNHGNFYPQVYYGTPRWSASTGYSPDLEGFLTGTSLSGSIGTKAIRYNIGTSGSVGGTSGGSAGVGFETPGRGFIRDDATQPWLPQSR